jgi:hypothetical protein
LWRNASQKTRSSTRKSSGVAPTKSSSAPSCTCRAQP